MNRKSLYQLIWLMILSCASAAVGAELGNELTFESTHLKFEAEQSDDKVEGIFKFTNTSDQTVKILDAKSSCGCTVPNLEKKEYAPGESGEIKAVFTIGNRVGNQRKKIGVITDASEREVTLVIETQIRESIKIRPRFILWDKHSGPKEVTITIDSDDDIQIHNIDVNRGFMFETKIEKPGEIYKIVITPPAAEKSIRGLLNIEMKNETQDKVMPKTGVHLRVRLPTSNVER